MGTILLSCAIFLLLCIVLYAVLFEKNVSLVIHFNFWVSHVYLRDLVSDPPSVFMIILIFKLRVEGKLSGLGIFFFFLLGDVLVEMTGND